MDTMLLNPVTWDLLLDSAGNIAMAAEPYALAQDAASAIKLFQGEYWYDTTLGVPYLGQILGKMPPIQLFKAQATAAALTVPGVIAAQTFVASVISRQVNGQTQVTNNKGQTVAVNFTR